MIPNRASLYLWSSLSKLGSHWRKLDSYVKESKHDVLLDKIIGSIRARNVFHPYSYYQDGWGPSKETTQFGYNWFETLHSPSYLPQEIQNLSFSPTSQAWGVHFTEGSFTTTAKDILDFLPRESHTSRFLLVSPQAKLSRHSLGPTVILLAGTGEHGYDRRACSVAVPLALRSGVSSIILESPFYGSRKPPNQPGSKLRTVSDLPALGRCTVEETTSLIRHFYQDNQYATDICVAGVSMGGLHSAMSASAFPTESVGVVSWLGPPNAVSVFTEGLLSQYCEWVKLQYNLTDNVYEQMKRFLQITDIENFPKPLDPKRAILVLAEQDLFVPFPETRKKWTGTVSGGKWKGAEIRVIKGGHVSATVFGAETMRKCIEKVLRITDDDPFK